MNPDSETDLDFLTVHSEAEVFLVAVSLTSVQIRRLKLKVRSDLVHHAFANCFTSENLIQPICITSIPEAVLKFINELVK